MWYTRSCLLAIAVLWAGLASGQYIGGPADGSGIGRLAEIICSTASGPHSFRGGTSDGATSNTLVQLVCAPMIGSPGYRGGASDGSSAHVLTQSTCAPIEGSPSYMGGSSDGASTNALAQSNCAPLDGSPSYMGGSSDGATANALSQSECAPIDANVGYFGNVGDGFVTNALVQSECTPLPPVSAFLSEGGDAFDFKVLQQTECLGTTPLPVELIAFTATCLDEGVHLEWSTGSEQDNELFTIERSTDGWDWSPVGTMPGAGNSVSIIHYAYTDGSPINGLAYYRLEQMDVDGSTEHSHVAVVNCHSGRSIRPILYPNPTREDITLEIPGADELLRYEVVNAWGAVVGSGTVVERTVVQAAGLSSGVYLLRLYQTNKDGEDRYQDIRFVKN